MSVNVTHTNKKYIINKFEKQNMNICWILICIKMRGLELKNVVMIL